MKTGPVAVLADIEAMIDQILAALHAGDLAERLRDNTRAAPPKGAAILSNSRASG